MDRLLLCFFFFQFNKQNIIKVEDGLGRVFDGGFFVVNLVLVFGVNGFVDKDFVDFFVGNFIFIIFDGEIFII